MCNKRRQECFTVTLIAVEETTRGNNTGQNTGGI